VASKKQSSLSTLQEAATGQNGCGCLHEGLANLKYPAHLRIST
jgi:hypothetical protein